MQLQQRFNFRTLEEGVSFEYRGARINKISPNHYTVEHTKYLSKQKPISFIDDNKDRPVTAKKKPACAQQSEHYNGPQANPAHTYRQ